MTPPPSASGAPGGHPEITALSEYAEGILPADEVPSLRGHLTECAECREALTSLDGLRHTLGELPAPERMPDDVAARIDTALAAEHVSRETEKPVVLAPRTVRPAGSVSRETRSGPVRTRARRRRLGVLGATAVATVGLGGLALQSVVSSPAGEAPEASGAGKSRLEEHVRALVSASGEPDAPEAETKQSPGTLSAGPADLPSCIRKAIGREARPLAVDDRFGYRGGTEYLVVLPHGTGTAAGADRVDAYVVDASCVQGTSGPGNVLLHRTYPRR